MNATRIVTLQFIMTITIIILAVLVSKDVQSIKEYYINENDSLKQEVKYYRDMIEHHMKEDHDNNDDWDIIGTKRRMDKN